MKIVWFTCDAPRRIDTWCIGTCGRAQFETGWYDFGRRVSCLKCHYACRNYYKAYRVIVFVVVSCVGVFKKNVNVFLMNERIGADRMHETFSNGKSKEKNMKMKTEKQKIKEQTTVKRLS